ncbi:hypothetical protein HPP92_020032 [Vanilla planifolia]|uniref:Uncharacterized protein n=1 Tax=Vanilla planifolia TaxID=51239 RepID=A0A835Q6W2_VANPL|nr:hypothetical protein HPP92_020032 [Vanilla planifolia]
MAGIALVLDLLKRSKGSNSTSVVQSLHSHGLFTAGAAAAAASAAAATSLPIGPWHLELFSEGFKKYMAKKEKNAPLHEFEHPMESSILSIGNVNQRKSNENWLLKPARNTSQMLF